MKLPAPVVDYRQLRPSNLTDRRFRHLLYLLWWPLFGLSFLYVERIRQVEEYTAMYCPLDDVIPFYEWFVIPYQFWFVYLVGMLLYTLFYDIDAFRGMMRFLMLTFSSFTGLTSFSSATFG